uniref:Uncharacterized protein n=1 Tax=Streptomyces clavuligerus TaxID=1901 RepID=Q6TMS4_STRCL|nr:hypothetical protein pSCL2.5.424.9 [Streptomyces clavuligerus]
MVAGLSAQVANATLPKDLARHLP